MYKDIVMPKILQSGREPDNSYDSFGVVIIEIYNYTIVGHVPRNTSRSNSPHVLNDKSKWIYRKLRGYLFSRFTKYP